MKGKIYAIGLGPGAPELMTMKARKAIEESDVLAGYSVYIEQISFLAEGKAIISKGMGQEKERVELALDQAASGKTVSLVCSGDSGPYGMAGLMLELLEKHSQKEKIEWEVIPGITAALSSASLLGAPIVEDFCTISLSDYMTPMEKIKKRVQLAAQGDFVIALYNPRSNARPDDLGKIIELIKKYRSEATPVGVVRNAYRFDQETWIEKLADFDVEKIDMFCTVIIGNSLSEIKDGMIVTKRGYAL